MQTTLAAAVKSTPEGIEADAILRSCVHCGFCLATCPTYQLLGDELDSPRGRIYLMKQLLEGEPVSGETQLHLDRCLTCRACETTCPSGVKYGRLLDIGRAMTEEKVGRRALPALKRYALRKVLPHRKRFAIAYAIARLVRGLLPRELRNKIPARTDARNWAVAADAVVGRALPLSPGQSVSAEGSAGAGRRASAERSASAGRPASADRRAISWPSPRHSRRVLMLEGCVQPTLAPEVNLAAAHLLDRIGISSIRVTAAGCCGAVAHHLSAPDDTHQQLQRNIDALWPHITSGAEAIIMTASACTAMLTDYGHLLRDDPAYAERAARVSALTKDLSAIVFGNVEPLREALSRRGRGAEPGPKVAFQSPCTLQHALKVRGVVESLLVEAGYRVAVVPESHLCCGSAGTYSILQPALSVRLLSAKVAALTQDSPDVIATANIGCQAHIASATSLPVRHWVELLGARI